MTGHRLHLVRRHAILEPIGDAALAKAVERIDLDARPRENRLVVPKQVVDRLAPRVPFARCTLPLDPGIPRGRDERVRNGVATAEPEPLQHPGSVTGERHGPAVFALWHPLPTRVIILS